MPTILVIPAIPIVPIVPTILVFKAEFKKKGRKKRKYKFEPIFFIGIYNPQSGIYKKAILIYKVY